MDELLETQNWFTYEPFYEDAAKEKSFLVYVEVGCWKGHSTRFLAKALQKTGKPFVLFAIDLWGQLERTNELWEKYPESMEDLKEIFDRNLYNAGVSGLVKDLQMDSRLASKGFPDGSVDFCFLDASHDYRSVKSDIQAWLPKIRAGGILAGHDYKHEGVFKAVNEMFDGQDLMKNEDQDLWCFHKQGNY